MINSKQIHRIVLIIFLITLLVGCGTNKSQREPDYWPTTVWRTSTPEEQGMDSEILAEMVEQILKRNLSMHSVTVIRNGYMVADMSFYPFEPNSLHQLGSSTKSISSALIGIAIQEGHIKNVDQPVLEFFPDRTVANLDENKENMTLEHLLMMAPGFACGWESTYKRSETGWSGFYRLLEIDDWVQYILDLPMTEAPGKRFKYCNSASFMLSAIIQETTGINTFDFAVEHLFSPLGIDDVGWGTNSQGTTVGSGGLYMKPHDMAKIGYLYLNEGRWDDTQIISSDWVAASTRKHITWTDFSDGYGYQWWIFDDIGYCAAGYAGQFIYVVPDQDMVVVFTGNIIPYQESITPYLMSFITEAVQSPTPLPPNPEGFELLKSKIQQASMDNSEPKPVPPLPEIAQLVSGHTYILDPNPLAIQSVSVTFPGESEALFDLTFNFDILRSYIGNPQEVLNDSERPVGLDNIYRFSPGDNGITMGMKGRWVSDETFVIYTDNIGSTGKDEYLLTFLGDKITLETAFWGSRRFSIEGRLEE